jgi:hypothetical protein
MKKRKTVAPIIVWEAASILFYAAKHPDFGRGWFVRSYHSKAAMEAHLRHLVDGAPPPKHWNKPKGWEWWHCYGETGSFRTAREAREYVL